MLNATLSHKMLNLLETREGGTIAVLNSFHHISINRRCNSTLGIGLTESSNFVMFSSRQNMQKIKNKPPKNLK